MSFVPIVGRELRVAARQAFTYYLRTLGVGLLLLASLFFGLEHGFQPSLGSELFQRLHQALLGSCWLLVPLLTADCISRERREGTLGLLLLTRLGPGEIVLAKGLAHGLRALTLFLAVGPVLMLPLLLGGVSWREALFSLLLNFSALNLALAAGLLASSLSRLWSRVLLLTGLLSCALMVGFVWLEQVALLLSMGLPDELFERVLRQGFWEGAGQGVELVINWQDCWQDLLSGRRSGVGQAWLWGGLGATLLALLGLLGAIRFAAWRVGRVWREEEAPAWRRWLEERLCRPRFFQVWLGCWMRHCLRTNPIGWLQQRSWSGRMVIWGWLAVIICFYLTMLSHPILFRGEGIHQGVAWLLIISLAFTAAGSFRRERENGILELLLVSPLGEGQLLWGRVRGLWSQFLPAFLLLEGLWFYLATVLNPQSSLMEPLWCVSSFVCLPPIGLYYSLRCRAFLGACLATLGVSLVLPALIVVLLRALSWVLFNVSFLDVHLELLANIVCQVTAACFCISELGRMLRRRSFALQRSEG